MRSNSMVHLEFPIYIDSAWELQPKSFHFDRKPVLSAGTYAYSWVDDNDDDDGW